MPIHDWTRVEAGIFHDFHHEWISTTLRVLNSGLLQANYYALAERQTSGFGPDPRMLREITGEFTSVERSRPKGVAAAAVLASPRTSYAAESAPDLSRRKVSTISVRHASGDHLAAVLDILSPNSKASRRRFETMIEKLGQLLEHNIHLLILDLYPRTKRDPNGLHSALWEEIADEVFTPPPDKPLTAVAYESSVTIKAYIEPLAVGERLPDMPLFLEPGAHVLVPLEKTYQTAFDAVPSRWRRVLESAVG